jgi:large subunit ribosomal protein LX
MAVKANKVTMQIFKITGNFKKGKRSQKFTKEIIIENKQKAEEYILSIMGSKHRVKRREITIENIEKISTDQVTDPIIRQMIGGK